ncbi:MAG: hypothetical protein M5U19_20410 [Microthrixaceae bacterium]|nr:hypothetical protein [Microthrixaceae bacterium]
MTAEKPRRTKALLITGVTIVVIIAAVVAWVTWPRGTTEISEDQAVEDFRRAQPSDGDSGSSAEAGEESRSATPEPGVYTYRAEGSEQVKLGPFPAEDRPLPETVSITVSEPKAEVDDPAEATECFDWTLNLFAEHTEETTWCVDDSRGLRIAAHTKHQKIGALSPTATLECDPDVLVAPGTDESNLECTLELSGGPAAISAELSGTATALPTEEITVGSSGGIETVQTTPLAIDYRVSGDLSGTWSEKLWLTEAMLPVRMVRNLDLSGPATLTEDSALELEDLSPTR